METASKVTAVSRSSTKSELFPTLDWITSDLNLPWQPSGDHDLLISLAPIWLLPPHIDNLTECGIRRIVAVSSTSVLTKVSSDDSYEQDVVAALNNAEKKLMEICERQGISWTIFRPTMIYGAGTDQNVTRIASFICKFRFFPIAGAGAGLRQPVHADDLAAACIAAADNRETHGRIYELGGGEVLSYRAMVERIFVGLRMKPRFLKIPAPLMRQAFRLLKFAPGWGHVTPSMADRVNKDLIFDCKHAKADFGFSPREFSYEGETENSPSTRGPLPTIR